MLPQPVPPFATGRMPVTCVARLMRPAMLLKVMHVPLIAKHPPAMLRPPVPYNDDVAVPKLATPPIENFEPGVEVPTPTRPFASITNPGVVDVANVEGEVVER